MMNATNRISFSVAVLWIAAAGQARADQVIIDSHLQGWVNNTGNGNGASDGNNTFTGNIGGSPGSRFNSWASFDLSGLTGTITSVTLEIPLADYIANSPVLYTISINDVNTSLQSLSDRTSGMSGYTDLGSGNQYGTIAGDHETHLVSLSTQAVADVNASIGKNFLLGFTNLTTNLVSPDSAGGGLGVYTNGQTFDNTSFTGHPTLILTTANTIVAPEPSTLAMLASAIPLGIDWWLRRRGRAS
jgi:hypothetical protein